MRQKLASGLYLSQRHGQPENLFPCVFFSCKLSSVEHNYDFGNHELLAVKVALEECRHWLEGACHPFTVLMDHRNLEYIQQAKRLNPREARWALIFTHFNFQITYRPGSKNGKADTLSQRYTAPEPIEAIEPIVPSALVVTQITWDLDREIARKARHHPMPQGCPPARTYVHAPKAGGGGSHQFGNRTPRGVTHHRNSCSHTLVAEHE